jgi:hypothetical protein
MIRMHVGRQKIRHKATWLEILGSRRVRGPVPGTGTDMDKDKGFCPRQ